MGLNGTERKRLMYEAKVLIEQSELTKTEKECLSKNIEYYLSIITKESIVKDCYCEWYKNDDGEQGINLVWDWELVKGRWGFNTQNGYSFCFHFGTGVCEWMGGDSGENGFYPDYDVDELELQMTYNHLIV